MICPTPSGRSVNEPDLDGRVSVRIGTRIFFAIIAVVIVSAVILLSGCVGLTWSLSIPGDNSVTGNFMIGTPHETQVFEESRNELRTSEGLDREPYTADNMLEIVD
jgi:hypothetical protein